VWQAHIDDSKATTCAKIEEKPEPKKRQVGLLNSQGKQKITQY